MGRYAKVRRMPQQPSKELNTTPWAGSLSSTASLAAFAPMGGFAPCIRSAV